MIEALPPAGTRGHWYATHHGGGWRVARKSFTCQQALCMRRIEPGVKFFDTCQFTHWPKTKRICAECARETL